MCHVISEICWINREISAIIVDFYKQESFLGRFYMYIY